MIKVSVMYPNGEGSRFDMTYYCQKHEPMVREKLGAAVKGEGLDEGLGGATPGSPPPYLAVTHLLFESVAAFQAAFGPHAAAILEDVPNYTNTQPVVLVSEVRM